jgi:hypothetical protein
MFELSCCRQCLQYYQAGRTCQPGRADITRGETAIQGENPTSVFPWVMHSSKFLNLGEAFDHPLPSYSIAQTSSIVVKIIGTEYTNPGRLFVCPSVFNGKIAVYHNWLSRYTPAVWFYII